MSGETPVIAIIGAGPAGSAMACLLALRGLKPIVFDDDKRPELLVGESLIPSVIPVLRKLGIEERVAASNNSFTVDEVLPGDWSVSVAANGYVLSGGPAAVTVAPGQTSTGVVLAVNRVPYIASLTPASGPLAGGTTVMITGLHLDGATEVQNVVIARALRAVDPSRR
jgi:NADPH-dependent 2,4-dienoyl-CoA reductase/sulfur reductase-like enzyme